MQIGLASYPLAPGDFGSSFDSMRCIIADSRSAADLWLFPECSLSGGTLGFAAAKVFTETTPFQQIVDSVRQVAEHFGTAIGCGLPESEDGGIYTTYLVCKPEGTVSKQRRLHGCNPLKPPTFRPGASLEFTTLGGCRCAVLACADFVYPETAFLACLGEPHLILCPTDVYPANEANLSRLTTVLRARALDSAATVLAVFGNLSSAADSLIAAVGFRGTGEEVVRDTMPTGKTYYRVVDIDPTELARAPWGVTSLRTRFLDPRVRLQFASNVADPGDSSSDEA